MGGQLKHKTVRFDGEIDDTISIFIKQKSSEFVIIHNNLTDCDCAFCTRINRSIVAIWEKRFK